MNRAARMILWMVAICLTLSLAAYFVGCVPSDSAVDDGGILSDVGGSNKDGGGDNCGGAMDCLARCKSGHVCSGDPGYVEDECVSECESKLPYMLSSYITEILACDGLPCGNQEGCIETAKDNCASDTGPYFDALCAKMIECNFMATVEDCIAQEDPSETKKIKCFCEKSLDALNGCIGKIGCLTINEDFDKCLEDSLGIPFRSE